MQWTTQHSIYPLGLFVARFFVFTLAQVNVAKVIAKLPLRQKGGLMSYKYRSININLSRGYSRYYGLYVKRGGIAG